MAQKPLENIKHGDKVVDALGGMSLMFMDLHKKTSLDMKTLQLVVAKLQRAGYINKDRKGHWQIQA